MKQLRVKIIFLFLTVLLVVLSPDLVAQNNKNERLQMAAEMKELMVNKLLNQWYPASIDSADGGFLSAFTYDFKPFGNQDKMIVTQARHVWSNSKAAEMFPEIAHYKTGARHGFEFLKNKLWDTTCGGFHTYTDKQGNVKKSGFAPKEAYGNSFAIYGLAAYYQASGDTTALQLAKEEFKWMEQHSHDPVHKGYFQHMEIDGTPITRPADAPTNSQLGYKDQNTSIHLLEAFTELYSVWPDSLLRERLHEMLVLVRDTITTKRGNLTLFFQPDWTPVSLADSSKETILKNRSIDHVSFGHDVETAYLMLEASHVLGLKHDTATMIVAKKMVDHCLENGWDNAVGGFYDEGYYFKNKPCITIIADTKNWWAQAEGLNTLLLMSDHYPNDPQRYFGKFKTLWKYVQTYLIDHEHGDWYPGGTDKEPQMKTALKGQIWKGTYHNLRSLMNCSFRLDPDTEAPTVPANVQLKTMKNVKHVTWKASADNRQLLGYNIYINNRKVGFTPLPSFAFNGFEQFKSRNISVNAVDLQGNESGFSKAIKY